MLPRTTPRRIRRASFLITDEPIAPSGSMSQVDRRFASAPDALADLAPGDRVCVVERLVEYRELLLYVLDH
jgi:hypothetical protein